LLLLLLNLTGTQNKRKSGKNGNTLSTLKDLPNIQYLVLITIQNENYYNRNSICCDHL